MMPTPVIAIRLQNGLSCELGASARVPEDLPVSIWDGLAIALLPVRCIDGSFVAPDGMTFVPMSPDLGRSRAGECSYR
jgi:hypothetical protein